MVQINNFYEFEAWLKAQDQQGVGRVATRSALRSFPFALAGISKTTQEYDTVKLALLAARAIITAGIACIKPIGEATIISSHSAISAAKLELVGLKLAYHSAAASALFANQSVLASNTNPTAYDASAAAAHSAMFSTTFNDAETAALSSLNAAVHDTEAVAANVNINLFSKPLWNSAIFEGVFKDEWEMFKKDILPTNPEFTFWRDWYQGFLDGKPLDWNLQREVALIPDADWDKGPAHIAELIDEIKARFLADKAPLAEKLELNPETGKFFVTPVPARKPDLLNTTLEKASDALDDALNGRNGLLADDRVARVLRRCFEKYTHNPERIEMDFVDAHAGLTRQMVSGELADSEEILSLAEVLKNGALDIRANHPDIAANRETRAARALQELTPEQKQQLEDAQPILEALTEGEAHQDMGVDIPALINDMVGPVPDNAPPVGPAVRLVNRAAKMSLLASSKETIEAIEKNSGFRMVRISLVLKSIIDIGLKIFGLF